MLSCPKELSSISIQKLIRPYQTAIVEIWNNTNLFCCSLKILSRRSCQATFSGSFFPHGIQKQHFRLAEPPSLPAAVDAVVPFCSTLFVRRQHKNLLRHNEHFPGSFGAAAPMLSAAMLASVRDSSGSEDGLLERRQQPQSFRGAAAGSTVDFVGFFLRHRWQQAVFRIPVQGIHMKPKHGSQHRRHLQHVGRGCRVTLCSESLSPFSDLRKII